MKKKEFVKTMILGEHNGVLIKTYIKSKKLDVIKSNQRFVTEPTDTAIWTEGLKNKGQCELLCFLGPLKGEASLSVNEVQSQLTEILHIFFYIIDIIIKKETVLHRGEYFETEGKRLFYISQNALVPLGHNLHEKIKEISSSKFTYEDCLSCQESEAESHRPDKIAMFVPVWADKTLLTSELSKAIN